MKIKADWFLLGMIAAIGLARAFPGPGAAGGWMHPATVTKIGVALIFFFHGLALSFGALKSGALQWPLHVLVQCCTFLLFPLFGVLLYAGLGGSVPPELKLGLFFLCALPSTVSSSVAMTAVAEGNVPAAVFNATLSNLIGVFLTPLWIALVLKTSGQSQHLGSVVVDLLCWLILPLACGQALHPWLGRFAASRKAQINRFDRLTILVLVYTSFCDSFERKIWSRNAAGHLLLVLAIAVLLFCAVMLTVSMAAKAMNLCREDRIAAMFCGSKKTLASGVSMATLIFGARPALGLILLPLMLYHPLQLAICGVLAQRWRREVRQPVD